MYMRIATELHLEAADCRRHRDACMRSAVFSATRAWIRSTTRSLPTVELYQAYADFNDMMDLFEDLLSVGGAGVAGHLRGERGMGEEIGPDTGLAPHDHGRGREEVCGHGLHGHLDRRDEARGGCGRSPSASRCRRARTTLGAMRCTSALTRRWRRSSFSPPSLPCIRWMYLPWPSAARRIQRLTERFELFICHSEMGECLLRAERSHRPASALPEAGGAAGSAATRKRA